MFSLLGEERALAALPIDAPLETLVPGDGAWEVELGFGKGRYLLRAAAERPLHRFLGIERASKYYRLAAGRAHRRGLGNLSLICGEALSLLSTALPQGFASALHVYFPDPWPKSRHQKRRLFDSETVDLVLGVLRPGGELFFATDFLEYGELVAEILAEYPGLETTRLEEPWPDGARTNYEAKFIRDGRPILRLHGCLASGVRPGALHPRGRRGVLAAVAQEDVEASATGGKEAPAHENAQRHHG